MQEALKKCIYVLSCLTYYSLVGGTTLGQEVMDDAMDQKAHHEML